MVAYSFKARFVEPILAGTKTQTIRADRKRHARPGEDLQLYTAMRTKQCKLIRVARCTQIVSVMLSFVGHGDALSAIKADALTALCARARVALGDVIQKAAD
jgi:uncharacterized protein YqfB (UPF0267 family)